MLRPLLAIMLGIALTPVWAQDKPSLDSLLKRSPFGSVADANAQAAPSDSVLELRGVLEDGNELWFSIYEASTKRSTWLSKADADQAYSIRSYDAKTGALMVNYQGRSLPLALKQAKILDLPAGSLAPGNVPPPASGAAVTAPNQSETQRLAAIAEEIRRRRALRQNQAGTVNNAQPAPTKTP